MSAEYQYQGCVVKRVSDGVLITSNDPKNADLEAYQSWVAAGNVPDPDPTIIPPVPNITTRQFLIQGAIQGLITSADALAAADSNTIPPAISAVFSALPSSDQLAAKITWAKMTLIERQDPLVSLVASAFNLTSPQIDSFFIAASLL